MTPHTADRTDDEREGVESDDRDRYAAIEIDGGSVVIYDQQQHTAWIQSDATVSLEAAA